MIHSFEERLDEKFPFRIYGIAGEPKSEFLTTQDMPDKIKDFIRQEISLEREQAKKEERERIIHGIEELKSDLQGHQAYTAVERITDLIKKITNEPTK